MLRDFAKKYYIDKGFNCAQAVLLSANEYYNLGLKNEDVKFVVAFGGGLGCGNLCGSLAGAMAVLGLIFDSKLPNFRKICASMVKQFKDDLSDTNCCEIIKKYKKQDTRCLQTVEICLDVLDSIIKENKDIAMVNILNLENTLDKIKNSNKICNE